MIGSVTTYSGATTAAVLWVCARHVVEPGTYLGSNQHQQIQHGACAYCDKPFVRTVDWARRSTTDWKAVT